MCVFLILLCFLASCKSVSQKNYLHTCQVSRIICQCLNGSTHIVIFNITYYLFNNTKTLSNYNSCAIKTKVQHMITIKNTYHRHSRIVYNFKFYSDWPIPVYLLNTNKKKFALKLLVVLSI